MPFRLWYFSCIIRDFAGLKRSKIKQVPGSRIKCGQIDSTHNLMKITVGTWEWRFAFLTWCCWCRSPGHVLSYLHRKCVGSHQQLTFLMLSDYNATWVRPHPFSKTAFILVSATHLWSFTTAPWTALTRSHRLNVSTGRNTRPCQSTQSCLCGSSHHRGCLQTTFCHHTHTQTH